MLQFNDLTYFGIPTLPSDWKAPEWLRIELGLFSGRLYFDWSEYSGLCRFLGVDEACPSLESLDDPNLEMAFDGEVAPETAVKPKAPRRSFAAKPLTFLQEWLAVRRGGQDFDHTPMGFLTQGKPLEAGHPFFRKAAQGQGSVLLAPVVRKDQGDQGDDDADDFVGVDDMGANNMGDSDDDESDNIVYDAAELRGFGGPLEQSGESVEDMSEGYLASD